MAPKAKKTKGADVVTVIEKAPESPNNDIMAEMEQALHEVMSHPLFQNAITLCPLGVGETVDGAAGFQARAQGS